MITYYYVYFYLQLHFPHLKSQLNKDKSFCQWRLTVKINMHVVFCCVFIFLLSVAEPATVQNPTAVHSARDDFLKVCLKK